MMRLELYRLNYLALGKSLQRHPDTSFIPYRGLGHLEAGVKSDVYVSGIISVSKYRPRSEATVKTIVEQDSDDV